MRERERGILILLGKAAGWRDRVASMVLQIVTAVRDGRPRKRYPCAGQGDKIQR